jgi:NADH:ubiquinone reductase (non-electrogenic)
MGEGKGVFAKKGDGVRVVILGSGFGAFRLLRGMRRLAVDVAVISPRNHFVFTPLLASTTVGTLEFRSVIESIRSARPAGTFHLAEAVTLDAPARILHCRGTLDGREFALPFESLVIAVGAVPHTFGIPGVREHALFLRQIRDARAIRQRVLECFERAALPGVSEADRRRLLRFVVVGGGPTGVEFAAEMHDFLKSDLRRAYPSLFPEARITLLEAGKELLSAYDATLSDYTLRHFRRQDIEVRTGTPVIRVEKENVVLKDGAEIPFGCLVWATGNAATEFVRGLPFEKDSHGRVFINECLEVPGQEGIYALGDCSLLLDHPVPATAQSAEQQGAYLARVLKRKLLKKSVRPFNYRHQGMLAYIGSHAGVADLSRFKGRGFAAFLFWRSVYLTKLVSMRNKTLVLFDWIRTVTFGREISRM